MSSVVVHGCQLLWLSVVVAAVLYVSLDLLYDDTGVPPLLLPGPGLVFSHDTLDIRGGLGASHVGAINSNGLVYSVALSTQPLDDVVIRLVDAGGCTELSQREIVFSPETWNAARLVAVSPRSGVRDCRFGLVHACTSADVAYNGLHARLKYRWPMPPPSVPAPRTATPTATERPLDFPDGPGEREAYRCTSALSSDASEAERCVLPVTGASERPHVYVLSPRSKQSGARGREPVVLVLGGVHGNEAAGAAAAAHIRQFWRPSRGRIVVLDRVNERGLRGSTRYVPGAPVPVRDLNRNFPEDPDEPPKGALATALWNLVERLEPVALFDLHEGWGFYTQLKANYDHNKLVGNAKFSKGSSIICTDAARSVAQKMLDAVNDSIEDNNRKFQLISPPVSGGLAARVARAYGTLGLVLETTSRSGAQPLQLRKQQQLIMVSKGMQELGLIDDPQLAPIPG